MHGSQSVVIDCWCGNRNDTRYYSGTMPPGYKYVLCSALMIILHSSFSRLAFLSPTLNSLAMEDKKGTKRPEVLHPVTPRLHRQCRLGLHHH
jgi:hypothetical protein